MRVLITGGAGYIGSHAALRLMSSDNDVVIVDNLTQGRGQRATIERLQRLSQQQSFVFHECNVLETERLTSILRDHAIEAVMHLAALAYVGESVDEPLRYYHNNVGGTSSLLTAMKIAGVGKLIFSSTCSTYGTPAAAHIPIAEHCPQRPINPYGRSKLMVEQIIRDHVSASAHHEQPFSCTALRYFNVAGSDPQARIGECHDPETHLIPIALQHAVGDRDGITIFGCDYDSPDGTCVRDYVHVCDLVEAHVIAMVEMQNDHAAFQAFNVGIGRGYSVREVLSAVEQVTGRELNVIEGQRRPGDPPTLFADASKLRADLDWQPQFDTIEPMIEHAWSWMKQRK